MRILITGVAGHIGSRIASYAQALNSAIEIVGIDDMSCGYRENVPDGVELSESCCGDLDASLFERRFDAVFHCAAYAAECMSPFVRKFNYYSNVIATAGLLNRCIESQGGVGRFVYFSSIAAYGDQRCELHGPINDWAIMRPNDPYGVAKMACEHDVRIAGEQHGLEWCTLRPHNVYGVGQSIWQRYRNVFGIWMRQVLERQPITIFGDGQQMRAYTLIDDILPCVWRAAFDEAPRREAIDLGASKPYTIREALDAFQDALENKVAVQYLPARHEVKHTWSNTIKSERLLGYEDRTSLRDGLRIMWAWAKHVWERYPERRDKPDLFDFEITKGMPESWLNGSRQQNSSKTLATF